MDIKFYEVFQEEEEHIKKYLPARIVAGFTPKTIQKDATQEPPAKFISIRTQSQIPPDWAGKLDAVLTRSQGYDHILKYLEQTDSKIACGYLGDYCSTAVAEHAVLTMMALLKQLKRQMNNFKQFNRDGITGGELKGRNALVIGVGNIGSEIASLLQGMRMFIKGVDIVPTRDDIEYVSLEEGIQWADVVFCALPLTDETKEMLNYRIFKKSRGNLLFINVSRGEISPLADLKKLLEENILAGISLDVYEQEKLLAQNLREGKSKGDAITDLVTEMKDRDNVIFTPHNAFNTYEALEQKTMKSVGEVLCFLDKREFSYPIISK